MSERKPREVTYTDPTGKEVTGWYLDGHVYQDQAATVPIAVGSTFRTDSGKYYHMTKYGGLLWSVPTAEQKDGRWNPLGDQWYRTARDLTEQLANRPAFSYDPEKDALWQGVKQGYLRNARRAMSDTIGRTSALTGGYASTYAQGRAQQAYDEQLFRLAELLPDYYDRARAAYDKQGKAITDAIGTALGLYDADYQTYLDRQKQARWEREQTAEEEAAAAKREQWEQEFNAKNDQWERQFNEKNDQWERQFNADNDQWQQQFDAKNEQWQQQFDAKNDQWQQQFDAKNDQWAAEFAQDLAKWEQQLEEKEKNSAYAASKEERSYSYRMAMLALQHGLPVSDALLKAAGIDKDYAETIRRYFAGRQK